MIKDIVNFMLQMVSPDEFKKWCARKAGEAAERGEIPASETLQEMWIAAHTIQYHPEPKEPEE